MVFWNDGSGVSTIEHRWSGLRKGTGKKGGALSGRKDAKRGRGIILETPSESYSMFHFVYCECILHCGKNAYFHKRGRLRLQTACQNETRGAHRLIDLQGRCTDSSVRVERESGNISDCDFGLAPHLPGMSGARDGRTGKIFSLGLCLFSHIVPLKPRYGKQTRQIKPPHPRSE